MKYQPILITVIAFSFGALSALLFNQNEIKILENENIKLHSELAENNRFLQQAKINLNNSSSIVDRTYYQQVQYQRKSLLDLKSKGKQQKRLEQGFYAKKMQQRDFQKMQFDKAREKSFMQQKEYQQVQSKKYKEDYGVPPR